MADGNDQQSGAEQSNKYKWLNQILNAASTISTPSESTPKPRIPKIPQMLPRDTKDYEKYYVPRVVSLGPYHHMNNNLEFIENLKPMITNKFVNGNSETLGGLYDALYGKIEIVRSFYEKDKSINDVPDDKLTNMMLQDGCFILHCIDHAINPVTSTGEKKEKFGLKNHHIALIKQDVFLLENQVPYLVLEELMKSRKDVTWQIAINQFISRNNIIGSDRVHRKNYSFINSCIAEEKKPAHLLELLHMRLVGVDQLAETEKGNRYTLRNVNELLDIEIHFRPSKSSCLANIKYHSCGFSATLELPPIIVDDSTRPMLLNLVAYEKCANVPNKSWVTSYICFVESLIDRVEDVKELRKAGVIDDRLGSDEEVVKLFNDIRTDLVPIPSAYAGVKRRIQKHWEDERRIYIAQQIAQLKHDYFKNPWSVIAFGGAVVALFLGSVQAYFTVWSASGDCDHLCKYIKQNHHL